MSSKHTPEPWSIKAFDDGTFIITEGDDTDDPSNMVIASKGSMSIVEGREAESTANAQLIADAPKLLEALRELVDTALVDSYGLCPDRSANAFGTANELLTKHGG